MRPHFDIPSGSGVNAHRAAAEEANLAWLRGHGMLRSPAAVKRYQSWQLGGLAARCWPSVELTDLILALDLKSFYFLFDDQFDRPEITDAGSRIHSVCDALCAIAHNPTKARADTPLTSAFADLWQRARQGMSPAWRLRTAHHWERYFCAQAYEALTHDAHPQPTLDSYYAVRGGTAATESVLDMIERLVHTEVISLLWHSPQLRLMRETAAQVPFLANDVYSYPKEAARGDAYNLVAVLHRTTGLSLSDAIKEVEALIRESVRRFFRLSGELSELCSQMALSQAQSDVVLRYAQALADWLCGHNDWMTTTARYAPSAARPSTEPGYEDDLLAR
ncbi:terpene synthase family protein [Streptomyces tremellae]|uniref:Terpene synthase n=1 Tax=Streptomyces tremellae TaxID=1124239 RepID=A0ABP7FXC4_9ACTN